LLLLKGFNNRSSYNVARAHAHPNPRLSIGKDSDQRCNHGNSGNHNARHKTGSASLDALHPGTESIHLSFQTRKPGSHFAQELSELRIRSGLRDF